jgi:P27 family predicted phage terminase small subunit
MRMGDAFARPQVFRVFGERVMGSRGPTRTPDLRAINGGADHRPAEAPPKLPDPALPKMPRWQAVFTNDKQAARDAAAEWKRVIPALHRLGALSVVDESGLVDYCTCHARVLQLERQLTAEGWTIDNNERGIVKNPLTMVLNQNRVTLQRYKTEFGLTPMARVRLGLREEAAPDDDSDLDEPVD